MALQPRTRTLLRWTAISLASLVVLVIVALSVLDWNWFKHPIERMASAKSGRSVTIAGPLEVHIWSWTPRVALSGLTVGNPPWEPARPMLTVESLQVQLKLLPLLKGDVVLPRVEVIHPVLYLHRETSGRANWTFENTKPTNAKAAAPPKLPVVRDFLIRNGTLTLTDDLLKLKVDGTVQAHEKGSADDPKAFRLHGQGTLNQGPFSLQLSGGPLINLDPEHPYPFDLQIGAGDARIESSGRFRKPFDVGQIDLDVTARGKDLADLFYLTQLALPNTPPFNLHVVLDRNGQQIKVPQLAGTVGASDLHGELTVDLSRKKPRVIGNLVSRQLRLQDLAASLGGQASKEGASAETGGDGEAAKGKPAQGKTGQGKTGPGKKGSKAVQVAVATSGNPDRLFPDAHLQVERVRAMDGDVRFEGQSVQAGSFPLKHIDLRVKLDDGVLSLDPLEMQMPQGRLKGLVRIDARGKVPKTHLDIRLTDIQLDQIKPKPKPGTQDKGKGEGEARAKGDAQAQDKGGDGDKGGTQGGPGAAAAAPLTGEMQARAVLDGSGDSVHAVVSDADGKLIVILPHGEIRSAFAELTGINVAKGLGLLLTGDQQRDEIRCGVAQFAVDNGAMKAQTLLVDTATVVIKGSGEVRLGPEELDLTIQGEPKKLRVGRLRTPVKLNGHLTKPSIGVDVGKTLKQGAIATALGAVVAPIAAVLAFVDPGLAKDQNCSALLEGAQAQKQSPETAAPPREASKGKPESSLR